jgi:hypothetical protein
MVAVFAATGLGYGTFIERAGTKPALQWRMLNRMGTFMGDGCTLTHFPPVLPRQVSGNLHVWLAITVVQCDPVYAFRQLCQLVDIVCMPFEQLEQCLGRNRIQFLAVLVHTELHNDPLAQGFEFFESIKRRLGLSPPGAVWIGHD